MAVTITVPGASSTTVTRTYATPANSALADSLARTLNSVLGLVVTSVTGGGTAPSPTGSGTHELTLNSAGSYSVPGGYDWVVDNASPGNLTIQGGVNLIGGDGNITFTNTQGATSSVVAGNGNDLFNLSGHYSVAAGNGFDQYNLSGTGQVSLGAGSNSLTVSGGSDTIFAGANSGPKQILGGGGSVLFYAGNRTTPAADFVQGGAGGSTMVGGNNEVLVYANTSTAAGGLFVAGAGNETLFAAGSLGNDTLYGSTVPGSQDLLMGGPGDDVFVGGSGTDSLVGGTGKDVFYIINATARGVQAGQDVIFNANPNDSLALVGYDSLYGGTPGAAAAVVSAALLNSTSVTLKDGTVISFGNNGGPNGMHITSS